jgi:hypothetical protein
MGSLKAVGPDSGLVARPRPGSYCSAASMMITLLWSGSRYCLLSAACRRQTATTVIKLIILEPSQLSSAPCTVNAVLELALALVSTCMLSADY